MKKKDIFISIAIILAGALTLYFYSMVKGSIKIDAGTAAAELQIRSVFLGNTTIRSGTKPAKIGGRLIRPRRLGISMDQGGHTWKIESRGPWGNLSNVKVEKNQTTTIRLGPPFLIKPRLQKRSSNISFDYIITGQAGEEYQSLVSMDNRLISKEASFEIIDEEGNVLTKGKFEYG